MISVVGSLNTDIVVTSPRMPQMGETLLGKGFFTAAGGKGANQAVASARLGAQTAMIGRVGNDGFGESLVRGLENDGIDVSRIIKTDCASGAAVIIVNGGDNFIVVDPGANARLSPDDVYNAAELIISSDMLICQLEVPTDAICAAAEIAKKAGVPVLLNPAPAQELPEALLRNISYIVPNEKECEFYTGIKIDNTDDGFRALKALGKLTPAKPVITLGALGCVFADGDKMTHMPAPLVDAVDTTAAGDCFCAALAVALCEKRPLREAADFAVRASAIAVTRAGAQPSLPRRGETDGGI